MNFLCVQCTLYILIKLLKFLLKVYVNCSHIRGGFSLPNEKGKIEGEIPSKAESFSAGFRDLKAFARLLIRNFQP